MNLSGWGLYPVLDCPLLSPNRPEDIPSILATAPALIARGNGRAYGDAGLSEDLTLSLLKLNRLISFDDKTGLLCCEAGVLLEDILEVFVPRGWFPPVVPGTKFVTVGGMVAADIHGKNHHRDGSFGTHVRELVLMTASGEIITCNPKKNRDIFLATLGGMGLTGIILRVSFPLKRILSDVVMVETRATGNLPETMELFETLQDRAYTMAWVDTLAQGPRLGRSLVMAGDFMDSPPPGAPRRSRKKITIPFDAPSLLLNRVSISLFNELYYRRGAWGQREKPIGYDSFFFPLDSIHSWNRLYGPRGFVQYQCVLPKEAGARGMAELLTCIASCGRPSFLAVLKLFGPSGEGVISFPMEGYTLALDFPVAKALWPLLDSLDQITKNYGGRIYLAKDSRCSPKFLASSYGKFRNSFHNLKLRT